MFAMADCIQVATPCNLAICMKALLLASMLLGLLVYTQINIFGRTLQKYPNDSNNITSDLLIHSTEPTTKQLSQENGNAYIERIRDALEKRNSMPMLVQAIKDTLSQMEESSPTATTQFVPKSLDHEDIDNTITPNTLQATAGQLDPDETVTIATGSPASSDSNSSFPKVPPRDIKVLITMFTTFINSKSKEYVQSNTLRNWAQFQPKVRLILFSSFTTGPLIDLATELGWIVRAVPKVNEFGTPYLKEMYQDAMEMSLSHFYGYINGDILFTEGLMDTLQVISNNLRVNRSTCSMVIGIRTNVDMDPNVTTPFYKFADIEKAAAERGTIFRPYAQDYFMMSCPMFPWDKLIHVVIGRPAYDNYLVAMATKYQVQLVDATSTILAFHQTGVEGNHAGSLNIDHEFNRRAIGPFHYSKGLVQCAAFYTKHTLSEKKTELVEKPIHVRCYGGLQYKIPYLTQSKAFH